MTKIFTLTTLNDKLTEDHEGKPLAEDTIRTMKITRQKDKYIIHELFRKRKKPLRIMSIKRSETYPTQKSIIENIKNHNIFIRSKSIDTFKVFERFRHTLKRGEKIRKYDTNIKVTRLKTKIYNKKGKAIGSKISFNVKRRGIYLGTTKQIQTNYIGRIKNFPQIIAYVLVRDIEKEISDVFLGISKKIPDNRPNKEQINNAEMECIKMAKGKFFEVYGYYCKSGKLFAEIIEKRYLFWKKTRVAN